MDKPSISRRHPLRVAGVAAALVPLAGAASAAAVSASLTRPLLRGLRREVLGQLGVES